MGFPEEAARLRPASPAAPAPGDAVSGSDDHEAPGHEEHDGEAHAGEPPAAGLEPASGEAPGAAASAEAGEDLLSEARAEVRAEAPAPLDPAVAPTLAGSRALLDEAEAARLRALELLGAAATASEPSLD
jgi:hypothetical protein